MASLTRSGRNTSVSIAVASAAVVVAAMLASVLVAACVAVVLGAGMYARSDVGRRRRRERLAAKRRRLLRESREERLEAAGVCTFELELLTSLVDEMTRNSPSEARAYQLEELLDRYVDVALAQHAYARQSWRPPLEPSQSSSPLHRAVRSCSIAWEKNRARRHAACEDLLDEVVYLIRLYAERAATPSTDHVLDSDLVERQLALLGPASP